MLTSMRCVYGVSIEKAECDLANFRFRIGLLHHNFIAGLKRHCGAFSNQLAIHPGSVGT